MCSAINDLSSYIVIIYKTWGETAWQHDLGLFALSPHSILSGSLVSHLMCSLSSVIFPGRVTLTLGFTSFNGNSYKKKKQKKQKKKTAASPIHSNTQCQVLPGTCVAVLALTGLEEPPLHMECLYLPWPSPVHSLSLWDFRKASTGATSLLWNFLLKIHKNPHMGRAHPFMAIFCNQSFHMITLF